jgi:hypothetical protein
MKHRFLKVSASRVPLGTILKVATLLVAAALGFKYLTSENESGQSTSDGAQSAITTTNITPSDEGQNIVSRIAGGLRSLFNY